MKLCLSADYVIDSDAEPWRREGLRIAMFGGPGSGKSWNNSLIAEQFLKQGGTVVIFQPRDEYFTLKEKFDVLSVGGVHAKDMEFALTSPSIYAKAVVEDGISMIFYTSAAEDEVKLIEWVSRFISQVLKLQEKHRRPLLLILEEAHEYAPRSAAGHVAPPWVYNRMIKAFKDCFTQGRKLNVIAVASSQRPQELNFTIRQLANLTFYGKFSSQDIKYIEKECLRYVRQQIEVPAKGNEVIVKLIDASRLVDLGLGEWLVIAGKNVTFIKVTHARLTHHGAETPRLEYVAPRPTQVKKTIDELGKSIQAALEKEQTEASELERSKRKIKDLEAKLHETEAKANIKLSVREMMEGEARTSPSLDSALMKELEEFRSGNKLTESVQKRLTSLGERVQELSGMEAERCDQLEEAHEKLKKYKNFAEALNDLLPAAVTTSIPETTEGPDAVVVTESLPEIRHKVERPVVQTSESNLEGRLISLALHGFFDTKRRSNAIASEITRVYAVQVNIRDLNRALGEVVQKKVLQREEASSRGYEYSLYPGVKERIKEIE